VQDDDVPRQTVSHDFTLDVRPFLRVASAPQLIEGRQGQAYTQVLAATGGSAPYTWSIDGGSLPPGVMLAPDGTLSGSPNTTTGSPFTFTAVAQDSASPAQVASRQLAVQVKLLDTLLVIVTPQAADGRVGTPYSQALKGYGGTQPYSWSLQSGTLPPGITITDSGTLGRLGGTPTQAGTFNFTLKCQDTLTSQQKAMSITVY